MKHTIYRVVLLLIIPFIMNTQLSSATVSKHAISYKHSYFYFDDDFDYFTGSLQYLTALSSRSAITFSVEGSILYLGFGLGPRYYPFTNEDSPYGFWLGPNLKAYLPNWFVTTEGQFAAGGELGYQLYIGEFDTGFTLGLNGGLFILSNQNIYQEYGLSFGIRF